MPPLATRRWGRGPLLVVLHGFTQTAATWGPFGELLGSHRSVLAVDLPGHGGSSTFAASLDEAAEAVLEVAGEEPFDLLGYSLGGRVALTAALREPGRLRSLVLIGTTAGIKDDEERALRRAADDALADRIEEEDDLPAFLGRWLSQDLFSDLDDEQAQVSERLANSPAGLASSLRRAGTGTQLPSWDRLDGIELPVLVLAGSEDARYCSIGAEMASLLPRGRFASVPGAGHACHLSAARATAEMVEDFLAQLHHPT